MVKQNKNKKEKQQQKKKKLKKRKQNCFCVFLFYTPEVPAGVVTHCSAIAFATHLLRLMLAL